MSNEWAHEEANRVLSGFSWTSRDGIPPLEWVKEALLSAEKRGYARGVEDAGKAIDPFLKRGRAYEVWEDGVLDMMTAIRALLPAPEGM